MDRCGAESWRAGLVRAGSLLVSILLVSCQSCAYPRARSGKGGRVFDDRTIEMTGLGVTFDVGMTPFQIFAAVRRGGQLATMEFWEMRGGIDGVKALNTTSWHVPVPASATVWAASGGVTASAARQYWVGWRTERRLAAMALTQEQPIIAHLVDGETLVASPLMMADGSLLQLSWQPAPGGHRALWRRVFRGALHTTGTVESERLGETDGVPVASIAEPVPGPDVFNLRQPPGGGRGAVVGWIEATAQGARLGVAIIEGPKVRTLRSAPLPGTTPLPRQRPSLRLDADGAIELAAMGERPGPEPSYVALRMPVSSEQASPPEVRQEPFAIIGAGPIVATAAHYLRGSEGGDGPLWFAVGANGTLQCRSPDGGLPTISRRDVPPSYPFPIVVTAGGIYEAFPDSGGEIALRVFDEGR